MASSKGKRDFEGQIRAKYFRVKIRNGRERTIFQKTREHLDKRAVYELEGHLRVAKEMVETYRTCRLTSGHCYAALSPTKEDFQGCLNEINQFTHPWTHFANYTIESWNEMDCIRRGRQAASLQRPNTTQSVPGRQPDSKTLRKMFLNQTIRPKTAAVLMLRRAKEEEERKKQLKLRPMTTEIPRDQDTWYKPRKDRPFTVPLKGTRTLLDQDAMIPIPDSIDRDKDVRALRRQFNLPDDYTPSPRVIEHLQRNKKKPDNVPRVKIPPNSRRSETKNSKQLQASLAGVNEEVATTSSLELTRMTVTDQLKSIDRLPDSKTEEKGRELSRDAMESLLRPHTQISTQKNIDAQEEFSECQSFESVSEISSDEDTKGDPRTGTKRRRRVKVKKAKPKVEDVHPCETDSNVSNSEESNKSKLQMSSQESELNQSKPCIALEKDMKNKRTADGTDHINRPQSSKIEKKVEFEEKSVPQKPHLFEPTAHDDDEQVNIGERFDQETEKGDDSARTNKLQHRALNTPTEGSAVHASSIITKEDEKFLTDMNIRSLDDPAFLASLTLEQHEALQEKIQRRKPPAEERTRFYVHPEKRHRKEEMFLMKRHNLLHRQILMPDYGHQDAAMRPQVRVVYSKADKQHALDFLTKQNTAKVISAKLRHNEGDLQQRVDFFIRKIDKYLKDSAEKEPHMTLVDQI
ncbi:hypothetical protein CAPTEDRAFT_188720 [Capitella teleta]|uniref:Uncharacterized protein n=1 Tax=Capitella teleta TaxID=283909 RepID=R7T6C8_CAPTE|nr:hypothetical protein CAPTEDRAFT_188720 [Capitella teleta]|eukprot:ELT89005.1 hypothetical protein CAPTEDRAFT_188720 [Capitella teleta]